MHGSHESPFWRASTLWNGSQLVGDILQHHANVDTIMWNEFKAHFHTHYVPRGTMKLKTKEFTDPKQGIMIVNEYLNSFVQLSRYALDNINTDEKK
jgi:hypothetical protein